MQGFAGNDCGNAGGVATDYQDYIAAVGVLLYNSNQNGDYQGGICIGAIDGTNLGNHDTLAGTHVFIYGNFGIKNQTTQCPFDGEAFYIDSPEAHLWNQTAVFANNLAFLTTSNCVAITLSDQNPNGTDTGTFNIYNNTCYDDGVMNGVRDEANGDNGEINPDLNGSDFNTNPNKVTMSITNNIAYND